MVSQKEAVCPAGCSFQLIISYSYPAVKKWFFIAIEILIPHICFYPDTIFTCPFHLAHIIAASPAGPVALVLGALRLGAQVSNVG